MNLYVLRHGIAHELGPKNHFNDAERELTVEGKDKVKRIGAAMARMGVAFDLVLSSPFVRARQTAEIVVKELDCRKALQDSEHLEPGGDARKLVDCLRKLAGAKDNVLLVGHEPYLSQLISLLVAGNTGALIVMKKAGLCKLTLESLRYGRCAALEFLLTPRQMLLMAE